MLTSQEMKSQRNNLILFGYNSCKSKIIDNKGISL